jgi:hypothetical protein
MAKGFPESDEKLFVQYMPPAKWQRFLSDFAPSMLVLAKGVSEDALDHVGGRIAKNQAGRDAATHLVLRQYVTPRSRRQPPGRADEDATGGQRRFALGRARRAWS